MGRPTNRAELVVPWMVDIVLGAVFGGIVGFIVSVNIVIYAGPDSGYGSSVHDVFQHSTLTGVAAIASLLAGPIIGVTIARRHRQRRSQQ